MTPVGGVGGLVQRGTRLEGISDLFWHQNVALMDQFYSACQQL